MNYHRKHGGIRLTASQVRKALPSLRRMNTPEGRGWTIDGKKFFVDLKTIVAFYFPPKEPLAELTPSAEEAQGLGTPDAVTPVVCEKCGYQLTSQLCLNCGHVQGPIEEVPAESDRRILPAMPIQ